MLARQPAETFNVQENTVAKIIVVTSGKGASVNHHQRQFRYWPGLQGHRTVVIDFDVGLRNLDLIMGCERRGGV